MSAMQAHMRKGRHASAQRPRSAVGVEAEHSRELRGESELINRAFGFDGKGAARLRERRDDGFEGVVETLGELKGSVELAGRASHRGEACVEVGGRGQGESVRRLELEVDGHGPIKPGASDSVLSVLW
jgi:hypothetical protein